MPTFAYSARDHSGSATAGTLVADSIDQAGQMLRAEGKYPTSIQSADHSQQAAPSGPRGSRMSRKDLIHVATQLAIMIDTGVTLSDALECVSSQAEKPNVKKI